MKKQEKFIYRGMLFVLALNALFFAWLAHWQDAPTVPHYDEALTTPTATPTPADRIGIIFVDEVPTAVPLEYTATPSPTPAPTATPTIAPTDTPTPTPEGNVKTAEVNGAHSWKPWAWYTAITDTTSTQYQLQQIARTDEVGRRIVQDSKGEWRFCVALPAYWAGGTSKDIGRCFDLVMANGAIIKCVLGDNKKIEHSLNGEGKYGRKGEIIEIQCDGNLIPQIVKQMGDASYFGDEWRGDVAKIIVYDENVLK